MAKQSDVLVYWRRTGNPYAYPAESVNDVEVLTPAEYDSIAVPKADSKRAAALLDEDRLALCKKTFDAQVRIALRD